MSVRSGTLNDLQDAIQGDASVSETESGRTKAERQLEKARERGMDEAAMQGHLVTWAHGHNDERLHMLFAVPNENPKHYSRGVAAGIPDLCLPVRSGVYGALWLELKRPGNDLRPSQYKQMQRLDKSGQATEVAWTLSQARFVLLSYLRLPGTFLSGY